MKKNIYNKVAVLILMIAGIVLTSCEADTEAVNLPPVVKTGQASNIMRKQADLSGSIQNSLSAIESYGIMLDVSSNMGNAKQYLCEQELSDKGFTVSVDNLEAGKTYYYCAFASSGYNAVKGEVMSFTTPTISGPSFGDLTVLNVTSATATISTRIADNGGMTPSVLGVIYKKITSDSDNLHITKNDEGVSDKSEIYGSDTFTATITGLQASSKYVVRAYGINASFGYGEPVVITTNESTVPVPSATTVTPLQGSTVVELRASILDEGTSAVTEQGFVYSANEHMPEVGNSPSISCGSEFSTVLSGLTPGETYFIRAYARNSSSTDYGYGEVAEYTVPETQHEPEYIEVFMPTIATVVATDVKSNSATLVGFVQTYDQQLHEAGFRFRGENLPVTDHNGTFMLEVFDLDPDTDYTFSTYCIYGNDQILEGEPVHFHTEKPAPSENDIEFPGM